MIKFQQPLYWILDTGYWILENSNQLPVTSHQSADLIYKHIFITIATQIRYKGFQKMIKFQQPLYWILETGHWKLETASTHLYEQRSILSCYPSILHTESENFKNCG